MNWKRRTIKSVIFIHKILGINLNGIFALHEFVSIFAPAFTQCNICVTRQVKMIHGEVAQLVRASDS